MLDFNGEEKQKDRPRGPVPAGSSVLTRLELLTPNYPSEKNPLVAKTRSGLYQLHCKFTVISGLYNGSYWIESIALPQSMQRPNLPVNMQTAARIGGSQIRAIIEASRQIDPDATDERSVNARRIERLEDLSGMRVPVKVGISDRPVEKEGRTYWNNKLSSVIPATDETYNQIMAGGEIITDGPIEGKLSGGSARPGSGGYADDYDRSSDPYDLPF